MDKTYKEHYERSITRLLSQHRYAIQNKLPQHQIDRLHDQLKELQLKLRNLT